MGRIELRSPVGHEFVKGFADNDLTEALEFALDKGLDNYEFWQTDDSGALLWVSVEEVEREVEAGACPKDLSYFFK